jgi:two-component system, LuxR family, response regulator TtrR
MSEQLLTEERLSLSGLKNGAVAFPARSVPKLTGKMDMKLSQTDSFLEDTLTDTAVIASELTKREIQILTLIVAGKSNKQVAGLLCRSQRTVEYHRSRLMGKLKVSNAVDLVKRAIAMGIV